MKTLEKTVNDNHYLDSRKKGKINKIDLKIKKNQNRKNK